MFRSYVIIHILEVMSRTKITCIRNYVMSHVFHVLGDTTD